MDLPNAGLKLRKRGYCDWTITNGLFNLSMLGKWSYKPQEGDEGPQYKTKMALVYYNTENY